MTDLKHSIDQCFDLADFKRAFARNAEPRMGKVLLVRDKEFLESLG
jgi:hypothetical protein